MQEIRRHAGPGSLVLLDEVVSGTDPQEGAALARALLEDLADAGALGMVTTHYQELKGLAAEDDRFRNAGMEFDLEAISRAAVLKGYHFTRGGRFYHLTGGCHKGDAVRIMADLYRRERVDPLFIGIGDSFNDLSMFEAVDRAYLVQKPDGTYDPLVPEEAAYRVSGAGPQGWRAAVEEVMILG